jgi:hypothetical protein
MNSRSIILVLVTACLLPFLYSPANAQWRDNRFGFNFNNPMSSLAATMVLSKAREDALAARSGTNPASASDAQSIQQIDDTALRFHFAGTYIKTSDLANQLGSNPTEREQYLKMMNAALDGFEKQTAGPGLQNDVAMALSYFFGENIRIYRGQPEAPDQQYVDLRNTIARLLSAQGTMNKATDRQKQEMYETLVAYTGLTQFGYEQAKQAGNEAFVKGYQQVAGQNLQTVTKMSPDSMNFTSSGLTVSIAN